jgi:hypothetical protein
LFLIVTQGDEPDLNGKIITIPKFETYIHCHICKLEKININKFGCENCGSRFFEYKKNKISEIKYNIIHKHTRDTEINDDYLKLNYKCLIEIPSESRFHPRIKVDKCIMLELAKLFENFIPKYYCENKIVFDHKNDFLEISPKGLVNEFLDSNVEKMFTDCEIEIDILEELFKKYLK